MAGIEKITKKIAEEADAKASAIIAGAKKQAEGILGDAVNAANEKAKEIEKKAKREAEETDRRVRSGVDLEKRKMTLLAKRELIEKVFAEVRQSVLALPREKYIDFLVKSAADENLNGKLVFAENDRDVAKQTEKRLQELGKTFCEITYTNELANGFLIEDGAVRVNCTVDEILESRREELEAIIVSQIF